MATLLKLLVVEDDADGRDPLMELFALEGYDATSVGDGATAIERLSAEAFDVLVMDLGLPKVTGLDVLRAARALADPPAVIVFTGHHRLKAEAEAAGCDAFVLKPELEELLARVSTAIAERVGRMPPAAVAAGWKERA